LLVTQLLPVSVLPPISLLLLVSLLMLLVPDMSAVGGFPQLLTPLMLLTSLLLLLVRDVHDMSTAADIPSLAYNLTDASVLTVVACP
jgi:hypothetical protein